MSKHIINLLKENKQDVLIEVLTDEFSLRCVTESMEIRIQMKYHHGSIKEILQHIIDSGCAVQLTFYYHNDLTKWMLKNLRLRFILTPRDIIECGNNSWKVNLVENDRLAERLLFHFPYSIFDIFVSYYDDRVTKKICFTLQIGNRQIKKTSILILHASLNLTFKIINSSLLCLSGNRRLFKYKIYDLFDLLRLNQLLLCGLSSGMSWHRFLTYGLYDPRLFLWIANFLL